MNMNAIKSIALKMGVGVGAGLALAALATAHAAEIKVISSVGGEGGAGTAQAGV